MRRDLNYPKICEVCGITFMTQLYRLETAKYCDQSCYAIAKKGIIPWNKGKSFQAREKHWSWIKDRSLVKRQDRHDNPRYKQWRQDVLKRDKFTCVICGFKGWPLHADHIKRYVSYPELRFEISNGRALCVPCHKKTGTWGSILRVAH